MPQTKKQKREKVLEYWKKELEKELEKGEKRVNIMGTLFSTRYIQYIQGQIDILTRKLNIQEK